MPLPQRQLVHLPLTRGLGGDVSRYLRPPERLEEALNVRAVDRSLGQRFGFKKLTRNLAGTTTPIDTDGPIRALGSTSDELLALGHRRLYAYVPKLSGWMDRGPVSPCVGRTREVYRGHADFSVGDMARASNGVYVYGALLEERSLGGTTTSQSVEFRSMTDDGDAAFAAKRVDLAVGLNRPYGPSLATFGLGAVGIHGYGNNTAAVTLERYAYLTSAATTAPTVVANVTTDLFMASTTRRTYEILGLSDGRYIVAWISFATRDLELRLYSTAHVVTGTATIAGTFSFGMGLAEAAGGTAVFLITAEEDVAGGLKEIKARKLNIGATFVVAWGPVILGTWAVLDDVTNLGLAPGASRIAYVWGIVNTVLQRYETHSRSSDLAGDFLDTERTAFNSYGLTRPFVYRGRFYQHLQTAYENAVAFCSHLLVDLGIGDTDKRVTTAALHSFGMALAPSATTRVLLGQGSAEHVVENPAGTFRHLAPVYGELISPRPGLYDARAALDDFAYVLDEPASITEAARGAALIGGGFVGWYDGQSTFELGFASPPIPRPVASVDGVVPAGTYSFSTLWEAYDKKGILHRSVPSYAESITTAAIKNFTLRAYSLPATHRLEKEMTCQWFRAGADAIPRRINDADELLPNDYFASELTTVTDASQDSALVAVRYDAGGVLVAATPEGARFARVVRERMVLGDFFRRDRIQVSKVTVPGTAGETAIAPEFIEPLGWIMEKGETMTGVAALGSATVVFTDRSIYLVAGHGPDATGAGDDFSRLTRLQTDTGCVDYRSVVEYPGGVLFQSKRGIYRLGLDHQVTWLGEPARVVLEGHPVVTSAVVVPEESQVRFTAINIPATLPPIVLLGVILVYDYRIDEWFQWKIVTAAGSLVRAVGATYVDGIYTVIDATGEAWQEDRLTNLDDTSVHVPFTIETGEWRPGGLQTHMRLGRLAVLANRLGAHKLTLKSFFDYSLTPTDTVVYDNAALTALASPATRMQIVKRFEKRCQSFRIRLESAADGTNSTGAAFVLHGITAEVGIYGTIPRVEGQARS